MNGKPTPLSQLLRDNNTVTLCLYFYLHLSWSVLVGVWVQIGQEIQIHPQFLKLVISHLYFADDLLLFLRGDLLSIFHLYLCFNKFSIAPGLKQNISKSLVYFGEVNQVTKY